MGTKVRWRRSPRARFDVGLIVNDMVPKGWNKTELARAARVSNMTVTRFLTGERQTNRTADRIAKALGYAPDRYIVARKTHTPPVAATASGGVCVFRATMYRSGA